MRMYFKYFRHQLKISLQYRSATFMMMFVNSISVLISLIAFTLLFSQFSSVGGYTLSDVLITYSTVILSFSISEFIFRGFDQFDKLIQDADLDVLLLRPRGIILQILGYKVEFGKIARILLAIGILLWVFFTSTIEWTVLKVITIILMVISGVVIYFGVFLLCSAFTVFTITGNEVINIFTNGGREMCNYPLDIYKKGIRNFFTFIIPFATFNYLPLQYVLGRANANIWLNVLSPVYGMLFVIPCIFVFKWALTKYSSSGT